MARFSKLLVAIIVAVIAALASACAGGLAPTPTAQQAVVSEAKVRVVVSIMPLATFVEQVGKDKTTVSVMVPPGADSHTYEPTPTQLVAVSRADVFVKVGSGLEFELTWMDKMMAANRKMLVVDSSVGIEVWERDPHIWLSPRNAKAMVSTICDGLVQIDPANEAYYVQNKDAFAQELDQLDADIKSGLAKVRNRRFVVFHPAWGYFAKDYGLEQIAIEEEGKEPTAKELAALVKRARELNIKVVFASPQFSPQSAQAIANEVGGRVILIDPLAQDYIPNLRLVLGELVRAME